ETVRDVGVTFAAVDSLLGIGRKRARDGRFVACAAPCRSDDIGRGAVFDPLHHEVEPVDIADAGSTAAVTAAGNEIKSAVIGGFRIAVEQLLVILDGGVGGKRGVGP